MKKRYVKKLVHSYFVKILFFLAFLTLFTGWYIHKLEPQTFRHVSDGVWWAFITLTTVGYGDLTPKTGAARLTAVCFIFIGLGYMSYLLFLLANKTLTFQKNMRKGKIKYMKRNHIIIIGWNERARLYIKELKKASQKSSVLLIDSTLDQTPDPEIFFTHGHAYDKNTLLQANIRQAKYISITANNAVQEEVADKETIITLLSIKQLCPNVFCIAEILMEKNIRIAKQAQADEIIFSNHLISQALLSNLKEENLLNRSITEKSPTRQNE